MDSIFLVWLGRVILIGAVATYMNPRDSENETWTRAYSDEKDIPNLAENVPVIIGY